jgi:hypothetical protein
MKKIICFLISFLFIAFNAMAANPITGYTPYTANSGFVLTNGYSSYSNGCINKAGSNYIVTYSQTLGGSSWSNIQNCFAATSTSAFPGALTATGTCLPQPPASGVDSCSSYYQSIAEPHIFFDPVLGIYHGFMGDALLSTAYQNVAHLTAAGTDSTFPTSTSAWTYESCQIASIGAAGQWEWVTVSVMPLAGGGLQMLVGGYVNTTSTGMTEGMYYMTNTTSGYPSSGWSAPVKINTSDGGPYVEFQVGFWYGNTVYIVANTSSNNCSGSSYCAYLYSASSQTTSSNWTTESTNALIPFPYITGLAGYSLNSGSMVGVSDVSFADMRFWYGLGAFTITAAPISNPQPVLSGVSSSLSNGTLTVSGSVALGNGSTPLWEVGLYNSTQNIRSQAAWSSWGTSSPGTVSNTFSGTITANQGDIIIATSYDVGLESAAQTITAPAPMPTYSITGTVSGAVQSGVTITLTGTATASTTTAGDGTYSFSGLSAGSYTVTPSKTGYTFSPASLNPTVTSSNVTGQDFTASAVTNTISYFPCKK